MNNELLEALNILEKEKNISKDTMLEAIETSLITACKNHFGKSDNVRVDMNPQTCEYHVFQAKTVVESVEDPVMEISLANAKMIHSHYEIGDIVNIEVKSKEFGRIATQNAKNVILQKIREEERKILCDEYYSKEKDIVTGIVQRYLGRNVSINLGKVDAVLTENEQVRGEVFQPTERIKLYILEVKSTSKGPKILVSRTHPELVKRLFESEVTEVKSGIVEIKSIAREAGSRTKIAVYSNDPDVDAVGACVGMNGARVNAIVNELRGEKIDIITWNDNPAMLIENALSPAKVISVIADAEEKSAKVVVPDYQLSLAIGKEGQNARLAARLTGFKIDIKSETQAREAGDFLDYENDYEDADEYDTYAEDDSTEAYGEEEAYTQDPYAEGGPYSGSPYANGEAYADGFGADGESYAQEPYPDGESYAQEPYPDGGSYAQGPYEDGTYPDGEAYAEGEGTDSPYADGETYEEEGIYADGPYPDSPDDGGEFYADGPYAGQEAYPDGEAYMDGPDGEPYSGGLDVGGEPYAESLYTGQEAYPDGEPYTDSPDAYQKHPYANDGSYTQDPYGGSGVYAQEPFEGGDDTQKAATDTGELYG